MRELKILQIIPGGGWKVWAVGEDGEPWQDTVICWGLTDDGDVLPFVFSCADGYADWDDDDTYRVGYFAPGDGPSHERVAEVAERVREVHAARDVAKRQGPA